MDWYQQQQSVDARARERSEALVNVEREVLGTAVALIARCLDAVASGAPLEDLASKRKVALANHGLNMLWSAWDQMLTGRYDAAATHWRSLTEIPDFLAALHADDSFADRMGEHTTDVKTSRRIVRDAFQSVLPGEGETWLKARLDQAKGVQPFAHVSVEATGAAIAVRLQDGKKIGVLRPGGGALSESMLRHMAVYFALSAIELLRAVALALQDIAGVDDLWEAEGRKFSEESWATLTKVMEGLGLPEGSMTSIHLLKSSEILL